MKSARWVLAALLVSSLATAVPAAMTINLGVVTKPGSAQNIAAEKYAAHRRQGCFRSS